jgi:hypothetical protein
VAIDIIVTKAAAKTEYQFVADTTYMGETGDQTTSSYSLANH